MTPGKWLQSFRNPLVSLLLALFISTPLFAAPLPAADAVIDSAIDRFILRETAEGDLWLKHLRTLEGRTRLSAESAALQTRLTRIRTLYEGYQMKMGVPPGTALSVEDKVFLKFLAEKELTLPASEIRPTRELPNETALEQDFESARRELLSGGGLDSPPLLNTGLDLETSAELRVAAAKDAEGLFARMNACVQSRPPSLVRKDRLRWILTSLGISEALTVSLSITATGWQNIAPQTLAIDMGTTALYSLFKDLIVTGSQIPYNQIFTRWFQITGLSASRTAIDGTLFMLSDDSKNTEDNQSTAVMRRVGFNTFWNVGTSVVPLSLYTFITGFECLNRGSKWATKVGSAVRITSSVGTTYAYFKLRDHYLPKPTSPRSTSASK